MAEHNFNAPFTRGMKRTHTILLPEMLEYHSPFLKAAFEGSGYRFEITDAIAVITTSCYSFLIFVY